MNRHKRRTQGKLFNLLAGDAPKLFDALFIGADEPEHSGQVYAIAGPAGRAAIGKIVPNSIIKWRPVLEEDKDQFPDDWREFTFVMANVAGHPAHNLPQYLLEACALEDCSPDQLAFLMMSATNAQGGGAAYFSLTEKRFVQVRMADQPQFAQH